MTDKALEAAEYAFDMSLVEARERGQRISKRDRLRAAIRAYEQAEVGRPNGPNDPLHPRFDGLRFDVEATGADSEY